MAKVFAEAEEELRTQSYAVTAGAPPGVGLLVASETKEAAETEGLLHQSWLKPGCAQRVAAQHSAFGRQSENSPAFTPCTCQSTGHMSCCWLQCGKGGKARQ